MLNYVGLNPDPRKGNYSLIITKKLKTSIKRNIETKLKLELIRNISSYRDLEETEKHKNTEPQSRPTTTRRLSYTEPRRSSSDPTFSLSRPFKNLLLKILSKKPPPF